MSEYICCECGLHFDEPKELDFGFYSYNGPAMGCPVCGGAYEIAVNCNYCGEEYLEEQLFDGLCQKCLDVLLTPRAGYAYLLKCGLLVDFFFCQVWNSDSPKVGSPALREHLSDYYMELSKKNPEGIKYHLRCYLFDREGMGQQDFAEWYNREYDKKEER